MGEPHLHIVVSPEGEGSVVIMALLEELTRGIVSGKTKPWGGDRLPEPRRNSALLPDREWPQ